VRPRRSPQTRLLGAFSMSSDLQGFLDALGARLRAAREGAGQSVTETARAAGVSRRYLTEAEAGRANPSILVLARLSEALGLRLPDLVDVPWSHRRSERVALIGLRGAGKSTVGRLLAREVEAPFVELDQRVESLAGLGLGEIFTVHGVDAFHRYEAAALEEVLAEGERAVLAVGGSIVDRDETYRRLRSTCWTVWLRAEPEEHYRRVLEQGDRRPMRDRPRAMDELRAILERRRPAYERADLVVDTDGRAPEEVAHTILAALVA